MVLFYLKVLILPIQTTFKFVKEREAKYGIPVNDYLTLGSGTRGTKQGVSKESIQDEILPTFLPSYQKWVNDINTLAGCGTRGTKQGVSKESIQDEVLPTFLPCYQMRVKDKYTLKKQLKH